MNNYTIIQIKNLIIHTKIGLYDWEKVIVQKLIIDIEITLYEKEKFHNITDTVDYDNLSKKITLFIHKKNYALLEELTASLCDYIMQSDDNIMECSVKVSKPLAIDYHTKVSILHKKNRL